MRAAGAAPCEPDFLFFGTALSPARPPRAPMGPPTAATPPRCFVLYDRHVEKNGGSTMRVLMKRLEEHGECAYWGYYQSPQAWARVTEALRQGNVSGAPPRLCGASVVRTPCFCTPTPTAPLALSTDAVHARMRAWQSRRTPAARRHRGSRSSASCCAPCVRPGAIAACSAASASVSHSRTTCPFSRGASHGGSRPVAPPWTSKSRGISSDGPMRARLRVKPTT